jgi:type II secretory pathway pseudopilin PulG
VADAAAGPWAGGRRGATLTDPPPAPCDPGCRADESTKLSTSAGEQQQQQSQQQQQQQQRQQQQQQQQQETDNPYWEVFGWKISKDDLITITLAVAISYGIRW